MKKTSKIRVRADGAAGFFARAREHGRRLDRRQELPREITVSFENASDMLRVLSAERTRLLRVTRSNQPTALSELAAELKRDTRAVSRDVDLLEKFGLLETLYETNPGHGRRRIVAPRAASYQLLATI
jgi:predicted transcriptional regulator